LFFNRRYAARKRKMEEESSNDSKPENILPRMDTEIEKSQKDSHKHTVQEIKENKFEENKFASHMAKYLGTTVTVFVSSGGISGAGFTGILFDVNSIYIKLIMHIGPAPACTLGNSCIYSAPIFKPCFNLYIINPYIIDKAQVWRPFIRTVGSIACIPVDKIAAFVHNAV